MFNHFFFSESLVVCVVNVRKYCRAGHSADDNMAQAHCMLIICEIIVLLLVIVQNKKTFYYRSFASISRCTIDFDKNKMVSVYETSWHPSIGCPKFTPPKHMSHFSTYWKLSGSRPCTKFPHNLLYRQWTVTLMLKLQYKKKSNQNMKDIFLSSLSLALLFRIRQFPLIKSGFITFVTQHT